MSVIYQPIWNGSGKFYTLRQIGEVIGSDSAIVTADGITIHEISGESLAYEFPDGMSREDIARFISSDLYDRPVQFENA